MFLTNAHINFNLNTSQLTTATVRLSEATRTYTYIRIKKINPLVSMVWNPMSALRSSGPMDGIKMETGRS